MRRDFRPDDYSQKHLAYQKYYGLQRPHHLPTASPHPLLQPGNVPTARNKLSNGCFCKKCHRTWIIRKGRLHLMSFIYKYGTSTTYPLHKRLQCFILMTFVSTIRILCNLPLRAIWVRPKILIQELPRFLKPHSPPNAFTGVTNARGPSPQPKAFRSPSSSLTTRTGSNQA